jgi:exonuclease III
MPLLILLLLDSKLYKNELSLITLTNSTAISKFILGCNKHPDVICLQEIKATPEQIPLLDFELAGYPYHYWFPATKKGYSGTAILSKVKPNKVVYGTGIRAYGF